MFGRPAGVDMVSALSPGALDPTASLARLDSSSGPLVWRQRVYYRAFWGTRVPSTPCFVSAFLLVISDGGKERVGSFPRAL